MPVWCVCRPGLRLFHPALCLLCCELPDVRASHRLPYGTAPTHPTRRTHRNQTPTATHHQHLRGAVQATQTLPSASGPFFRRVSLAETLDGGSFATRRWSAHKFDGTLGSEPGATATATVTARTLCTLSFALRISSAYTPGQSQHDTAYVCLPAGLPTIASCCPRL